MRGDLALLNGEVHDLVRASAVTPGVDVRRAGSHVGVTEDAAVVGLDAAVLERERSGVRRSAQPVKHRLGADFVLLAVSLVHDHFFVAVLPRVGERAAGVDGDAFVEEGGLHFAGDIVVERLENVRAALEQRHFDIESRKKLGELDRHRAAAKHDDRLGQRLKLEGVVAGDAAELGQARQRQLGDPRAGGNHEVAGGDRLAVVQLERVRVAEHGQGADQLEAAVLQLAAPIAGELLDHRCFAPHHRRIIEADFARFEAPELRAPGLEPHIGRVQQRFRRHATAQDAEPAQFPAGLDDDGAFAGGSGRTGGGIAGAASADHGNIKIVIFHITWPRCNQAKANRKGLSCRTVSKRHFRRASSRGRFQRRVRWRRCPWQGACGR